jgi:hypothetical protein
MELYNSAWSNYTANYSSLISFGLIMNQVKLFEPEVFIKLRGIYKDSIPAFMLLLDNNLVQKHCYERAKLMAYVLGDNCEVITANIDGLKHNPRYIEKYINGELSENYAEHCYVRRKDEDGIVWIYDTSMGYKIQEGLYNKLQHPEITSISKNKANLEDLELRKASIEEVKDELDITLSTLKQAIKPIKEDYRDIINQEFKVLEESLNSTNIEIKEEIQNGK